MFPAGMVLHPQLHPPKATHLLHAGDSLIVICRYCIPISDTHPALLQLLLLLIIWLSKCLHAVMSKKNFQNPQKGWDVLLYVHLSHFTNSIDTSKHVNFVSCIASEINSQTQKTYSWCESRNSLLPLNTLKSRPNLPKAHKLKQIRLVFLPRAIHI